MDFNTVNSKELRPQKFCIRGIPPKTDTQLVIEDVCNHGFKAIRATIRKRQKSGRVMLITYLHG